MAYHPETLDNFWDDGRATEVATMPNFLGAIQTFTTGTMTSGTVYAGACRVRTAKTYTTARICAHTAGTLVTVISVGVWNSSGTLLTYADFSSQLSSGALTSGTAYTAALNANQALTQGQVIYLGVGQVATTTTQGLCGVSGKSALMGLTTSGFGGKTSNTATGFTAAASTPNLTTTASGVIPFVQLF